MSPARLPSFFIIGAMKSATSTLHNQLAAQAGIFMSSPKEPNFFSDDARYAQGVDWYQSLFSSALQSDICGESSTHYTKLPDHPNTIRRLRPLISRPKFIYVMRHPVDRLVSHYMHQWSEGVITCDINQAIDSYPELINYSLYGMQIRPYVQTFGSEAVLPVFFEQLKNRPDFTLERVGEFIGCSHPLRWVADLSTDNESSQRIRKFPGYRWLVEARGMTVLRRHLVPKLVRNHIKNSLRMRQRPQISEPQLRKIKLIFDEDLRALTDWLGVKISCDHFDQPDKITEKINSLI